MKMYSKSDLHLFNGLLVSDISNDVILPNTKVVKQANLLETLAQKVAYLAKQPSAVEAPSLDGFVRESINDDVIEDAKFKASTPLLDIEVAKSMAMMDEIDDMQVVEQANKLLDHFKDLLLFVSDDCFVGTSDGMMMKFDTPTLGSVLELTKDDVISVVAAVAGLEKEDDAGLMHKVIPSDELDDEDIEALMSIIKKHDENAEVVPESIKINKYDE